MSTWKKWKVQRKVYWSEVGAMGQYCRVWRGEQHTRFILVVHRAKCASSFPPCCAGGLIRRGPMQWDFWWDSFSRHKYVFPDLYVIKAVLKIRRYHYLETFKNIFLFEKLHYGDVSKVNKSTTIKWVLFLAHHTNATFWCTRQIPPRLPFCPTQQITNFCIVMPI
jgi:hypothetical protein